MKRRAFLKAAAGSAVVAAAPALPKPALAQSQRKWRLVTTWPKNLPGLGTGAQYFADQVTKCTGGRLTVQLFAAGEIVPAFESIDAVKAGTIEMGHGCPYYWKGKAPAAEFVSNFPFGLTAQEYNAWYHFGGGDKLCDELYSEAFGCKYLVCGNTGVQHPGWSRKEVNTLEDFKGLKIRMPGLGGEVMKRLGATVVNLPGGEVTAALASGTIDWVEWNNPYGEASLGFHRHAKYYYTPGWHEFRHGARALHQQEAVGRTGARSQGDRRAVRVLGQCCHAERVPGALRPGVPAIRQAVRRAGPKAHRRPAQEAWRGLRGGDLGDHQDGIP